MLSNKEISRSFNLYAELLLLHEKDERLSKLLSGAAYRIRRIDENVMNMSKDELSKLFRRELTSIIAELKKKDTIETLDKLVQLTPSGLFDIMRIKGLGGKKIA